jgi:subtilisin family serine protease
MRVLGIDIASAGWSSVGNAIIEFDADSQKLEAVRPAVIDWPSGDLSPNALADAIDAFARANDVSAVALDGPQGWRDPATPAGLPGVGRRCEFECRTQAKTGVYPTTYPGNQRSWIEFSIAVFDRLLSKPDVILADATANQDRRRGYLVAECYPTSAWRSSGLSPMPGKSKRPDLASYAAGLRTAYDLPPITLSMSHDDLQAIVAALVAVAIVGGPARAIPCGTRESTVAGPSAEPSRIEGFIWNVSPRGGPRPALRRSGESLPTQESSPGLVVRVTQAVIDQVARAGLTQAQIAFRGMAGGTQLERQSVRFQLCGMDFELRIGDSNASWRSHQDDITSEAFERLYALLGDEPGVWKAARLLTD